MAAAKERLFAAGLAKFTPLTQRLVIALHDAQMLAMEIEAVCQDIGLGGVEKPEHPIPVLLPGQLVDWQLDLARQKGLWS
ncbi:MAG TPA: hypothetical protein VK901_03630 [Nitrospiraceae bacterium]|nr:hypothetical protein [Nitrospiraceae bacterium]